MADDAKAEELLEQLRDGFNRRIRETLRDYPPHQALQLADALCTVQLDVLAGMRVQYKARPEFDTDAVVEDWRRGLSIGDITKKHKISRATAYRLHPNRATRSA